MSSPFEKFNNERWRQAQAGRSGVPPRQDQNAAAPGMSAAPRQHVSWATGTATGTGFATPSPPTTDNRAAGTGGFNPSAGVKTSGLDMSGASFGSPGDASDITVPGPFHNPYLGKVDKSRHYSRTVDGLRFPPGFRTHVPFGSIDQYDADLRRQLVEVGWNEATQKPLFLYDCITGAGYNVCTGQQLRHAICRGEIAWDFYAEPDLPRMPYDPVLQFGFAWNYVPSNETDSGVDHGWNFSNANPIFQAALQYSPEDNAAAQVDLFGHLPNFKAASDNVRQALYAGIPLGIKSGIGGVSTKDDALAAVQAYLRDHVSFSQDRSQAYCDLGALFQLVTAHPNLPHLIPYEFISLVNYIQTENFPSDWNSGLQPRPEVSLLHAIGASSLLNKLGGSEVKLILSAPSATQAALETEFKTFDRDSIEGEIETQHDLKHIGTKSGDMLTSTTKPQVLKEHCEMSSELLLFVRQNLAPGPMRDMFVGMVEMNCGLAGVVKSQCAQEVSKITGRKNSVEKGSAERTLSSFRIPQFSYQYFAPTITPDFCDSKTNMATIMERDRSKPVSPFCSSDSVAHSLGFPKVGVPAKAPPGTIPEGPTKSATSGCQQGQSHKRSRSQDAFGARYRY